MLKALNMDIMNYFEEVFSCELMQYFRVIWLELWTGSMTVAYMHGPMGIGQGI